MITMNLKISDLRKLGNTTFGNDHGQTCFILTGNISNIESIFLREIMDSMGNSILSTEHWTHGLGIDDLDKWDILATTDMPWSEYMKRFGGDK